MTVQTRKELVLTRPEQMKAIADPTRTRILQVLEDRPASAKQLAGLLKMSHGKVGHHLKVLERHGLVEVVEERAVRALTEKLYGPTYDYLRVEMGERGQADPLVFLFEQAAREAAPAAQQPFEGGRRIHATRMPVERAAEFARRLEELADEFDASGGEGPVFGFAAAVYRTTTPGEPR